MKRLKRASETSVEVGDVRQCEVGLRNILRSIVCSKCHPFYTGKQKFVDSAGRVERFKQKFKWTKDSAQGDSAKATGDSGTDDQSAVAVEEKSENNSSAD